MQTQKELLHEWYRRVAVTQYAHYLSADHFLAKKFWLGGPTVLLTTLVGTSVFTAIGRQPEMWLQILVGLASVAAALLASLQTFMSYSERAEKHRMVGAKYGALGRELEQMRASGGEVPAEVIAGIRSRLDDLALEAPNKRLKSYRRAGATEIAVLKDET